jgi:hypothetical protein
MPQARFNLQIFERIRFEWDQVKGSKHQIDALFFHLLLSIILLLIKFYPLGSKRG